MCPVQIGCTHLSNRVCTKLDGPCKFLTWEHSQSECEYYAQPKLSKCLHFGEENGLVTCPTCRGGVQLKTFACAIHSKCTPVKQVPGVACCNGPCEDYSESTMLWSYGVTTVPSRRATLLPRTLASLAAGGFDYPWLFVDGPWDGAEKVAGVTQRTTPIRVFGNWWLALIELYIRQPTADRFAIFQDDILCCRNLRQYLERSPYPDKGYLNLYTEPRNNGLGQKWHLSNQRGLGALALVFSRRAVLQLLVSDHMAMKPIPVDVQQQAEHAAGMYYRGQHSLDGGVVTAFAQCGWKEYIHNPSLVQHIGEESSFRPVKFPPSTCFAGEDFDATSLPAPAAVVR